MTDFCRFHSTNLEVLSFSFCLLLAGMCIATASSARIATDQNRQHPQYIQSSSGFSMVSPFASTLDPPVLFGDAHSGINSKPPSSMDTISLNPAHLQGLMHTSADFDGGYLGACTDGEYIYMVPYASTPTRLRRISRKTGQISDASEFVWPDDLVIQKGWLFCGCAFDGFRGIWFVPSQASHLVRVDTVTKQMALYNNWPQDVTFTTSARFCGAVIDPSRQDMWLIPYGASHPVKVAGFMSTKMSPTPPADVGMERSLDYPAGVHLGATASRNKAFFTAVLVEDSVWLVPYDASHIVKMPLDGEPMVAFGGWPNGVEVENQQASFIGGIFDQSRAVWLIPAVTKHLVKVDIYTGAMHAFNAWPNGLKSVPDFAFGGAVFDGKRMWIANNAHTHLVLVDTTTGDMEQLEWPAGHQNGRFSYGSIVFDGVSLWLIPRNAPQIVRFVDTSRTHLVQNGLAFSGWQHSASLIDNLAETPLAARFRTPGSQVFCAAHVRRHVWVLASFTLPMARIHTITGATTFIPWADQVNFVSSAISSHFFGMLNDGQGSLWVIPRYATQLASISTVAPFEVTTYDLPSEITDKQANFFVSGCLNTIGQIVMTPDRLSSVGVFDLATKSFAFYDKWPTGISTAQLTTRAKFLGAVCNQFDGSTFLVPYNWNHLVKFNPFVSDDAKLTLLSTSTSWPSGFPTTGSQFFSGGVLSADGGTLWLVPSSPKLWVSVKLPTSASSSYEFSGHANWPDSSYTAPDTRCFGATFDGHSLFGSTKSPLTGLVGMNASQPIVGKMEAIKALPIELESSTTLELYSPLFDGVSIWVPDRKKNVGVRLVDRSKVLFATDGFSQTGLLPRAGTTPLPNNTEEIVSDAFGGFSQHRFGSAIYDGGRYIYMTPTFEADMVDRGLFRFDVETGERTTVINSWPGMDFDADGSSVHASGGGVLVGADHIFLVPGRKQKVARVNLNNETITVLDHFPTIPYSNEHMPFFGGAFEGEHVWMFPRRAWSLLKIDPLTLKMSSVRLPADVVAGSINRNAFCGGVYDGEKYLVLPPDGANGVLLVRRDGGETIFLDDWPEGYSNSVSRKFCGGASDGTWVWLAPMIVDVVVKVYPEKQLIQAVGDVSSIPRQTVTIKFHGICSDGEFMYLAPLSVKSIVRVNIKTHQLQQITSYPSNFTVHPLGTYYTGCVFDGRSVWMIPNANADMLRFKPLETPKDQVILQDGNGYSGVLPSTLVRPMPNVLQWNGTNHGKLADVGGYLTALFDIARRQLIVIPAAPSSTLGGLVLVNVDNGHITRQLQNPAPAPTTTFRGAVFLATTRTLYLCEASALRITKVEVDSGAASNITVPSPVQPHGDYLFSGATYDGKGGIFLAPRQVSHFVKIVPGENDTVVPLHEASPVAHMKYCGVVADTDGSVYFIPQQAVSVAKISADGDLSFFNQWPTTPTNFQKTVSSPQYCGGTIAAGRLWMSPLRVHFFGIVSVSLHSGAMIFHPIPSFLKSAADSGKSQFVSGIYDGRTVYISCGAAGGLVAINAATFEMEVRETFPHLDGTHRKKTPTSFFGGITFDGQSLWLIPSDDQEGLVQFSPSKKDPRPTVDELMRLPNQDGMSWSPPLPYDNNYSQSLLKTGLSEDFFVVPKRVSGHLGFVFSHTARWAYAIPGGNVKAIVAINTFSGATIHHESATHLTDAFGGGAFVPPKHPSILDLALNPNLQEGFVFLVPGKTARDPILFNVADGTFITLSMPSEDLKETYYHGAQVTPTSVWFFPHRDPKNTRVIPRWMRHTSSINVSAVLPASFSSESELLFTGAVGDNDGWMWMVPATSKHLVKVHSESGEIIVFNSLTFPAELKLADSSAMFAGGTFDGTNVWFTPYIASHFLVVNPHIPGAMRLVAVAPTNLPDYTGTVFMRMRFDPIGDSLYTFPVSAHDNPLVLKINPKDGTMVGFGGQAMFPKPQVGDSDGYRSTGFDGKSLWLIGYSPAAPLEANSLRWVDKHKAVYSTTGQSSSGLLFVENALDAADEQLDFTLHPKIGTSDDTFRGITAAAFDGNTTIYMLSTTPYVLAFNTKTMRSRHITEWPVGLGRGAAGGLAFNGMVFDNHRYIWLAPFEATGVARLDVTNEGAIDEAPISNIGTFPGIGQKGWGGGACDNQYIWFAPRASTVILKISIFDDHTASAHGQWPNGVGATTPTNFLSVVYDGEKYLWLPPGRAKLFVRVDSVSPASETMKGYGNWPKELKVNWGIQEAFLGCTYDHKRRAVWATPYFASHMIRLDIDSGNMKAISIFYNQVTPTPIIAGFTAATYTGGDALFVQGRHPLEDTFNNGTSLVRFNVLKETIENYKIPPQNISSLAGPQRLTWVSCVYDGASLWHIPLQGKYMARWTSKTVDTPPPPIPSKTKTLSPVASFSTSATQTSQTQTFPYQHSSSITVDPFRAITTTTTTNDVEPPPLQTQTFSHSASTHFIPGTPEPTSAPTTPTPQPPPPPRRVVKITTILPGGEDANTAVMTSAGGSAVATSTFAGTGTVTSVARVSAATRMLDCPLAEDDPRPSYFELPLQFVPVGSEEDPTRHFAGAALLSSLLGVVITAGALYVERTRTGNPTLLKVLGGLSAAHCMYFGPNALSAATTVVVHTGEASPFAAAVASYAFVLLVAGYYLLFVVVKRAPQLAATRVSAAEDYDGDASMKFEFVPKCLVKANGSSTGSGSSDEVDSQDDSTSSSSENDSTATSSGEQISSSPTALRQQWFLYHTEPWYDGTTDFNRPATRLYSVAEFSSAAVAQILAGLRPADGCTNVAWGILIISLAMLAYLVFIRPYRTRLDTIFSVAVNGIQFTMTAAVLYALRAEVSDEGHVSLKIIEGCLYILVVIYYVQVLVQGYWAYHCAMRRKAALEASETKHAALLVMTTGNSDVDSMNKDELSEPLVDSHVDHNSGDIPRGDTLSDEEMAEQHTVNPLKQ